MTACRAPHLSALGVDSSGWVPKKNVVASTLWSPSPEAWPDPTWMYDVTFHDCGPGSNWSLDPAELSIVFAPDSKVSQITLSMPGHPFDSKDSPFNPSNRSQ